MVTPAISCAATNCKCNARSRRKLRISILFANRFKEGNAKESHRKGRLAPVKAMGSGNLPLPRVCPNARALRRFPHLVFCLKAVLEKCRNELGSQLSER